MQRKFFKKIAKLKKKNNPHQLKTISYQIVISINNLTIQLTIALAYSYPLLSYNFDYFVFYFLLSLLIFSLMKIAKRNWRH